jgi:hypothetical protein
MKVKELIKLLEKCNPEMDVQSIPCDEPFPRLKVVVGISYGHPSKPCCRIITQTY